MRKIVEFLDKKVLMPLISQLKESVKSMAKIQKIEMKEIAPMKRISSKELMGEFIKTLEQLKVLFRINALFSKNHKI